MLVGPGHHGGIEDVRVLVQHVLDLDGRDVLTAGNDDVLGAVLELDVPTRGQTRDSTHRRCRITSPVAHFSISARELDIFGSFFAFLPFAFSLFFFKRASLNQSMGAIQSSLSFMYLCGFADETIPRGITNPKVTAPKAKVLVKSFFSSCRVV